MKARDQVFAEVVRALIHAGLRDGGEVEELSQSR